MAIDLGAVTIAEAMSRFERAAEVIDRQEATPELKLDPERLPEKEVRTLAWMLRREIDALHRALEGR